MLAFSIQAGMLEVNSLCLLTFSARVVLQFNQKFIHLFEVVFAFFPKSTNEDYYRWTHLLRISYDVVTTPHMKLFLLQKKKKRKKRKKLFHCQSC